MNAETNKSVLYESLRECFVCGFGDFTKICRRKDFDTQLGEFDIVECKHCKMIYTLKRPTEQTLPFLYLIRNTRNFDNGSVWFIDFLKRFLAKRQIKNYMKRLNFPPKSFVDFGCGNGLYACAVKRLFPRLKVSAVDFSKIVPAKIQEYVGGGGGVFYLIFPRRIFLQYSEI
ncbi:MAG: hypothetical protein LBG46_04455 [Elusimicrobiota bacterium]|jgi:SAM-dependent methyltransferase|nr:hypothetical protein [Elusimicrobiota bacterium]